ncbi:sigma-70 family RNA polymerase sigma factor [Streptomyces sp. CB01881]|uniref:RNA polymerase sigma factor n=1 Tax=Streptomyces sp. CB01881 TaxID=2078691 RepID=UPI000CDC95C6|nr:sigma-70 family RNA polymerase sigma factor [Streptomyces sp. CB01881]AUY53750.1 hypothetical protein C2142_38560 [Streptomyces sp. CB01881]TYC68761.1 sigma-70 family RNA polymerase sigma factor [Streptomyces sp. CB01881]
MEEDALCSPEDFFRKWYPIVRARVELLYGDHGLDSEAVTDDAFVALFKAQREGPVPHPSGYLLTAAFNGARDYHRKRRRRLWGHPVEPADLPDAVGAAAYSSLAHMTGPAEALELREGERYVLGLVNRLPQKLREVFVLVHVARMDREEAARVLDIKPSALRARLSRASAKLRKIIDKDRNKPETVLAYLEKKATA